MSMTQFESQIWRACQRILENPKMRKMDLLEWRTTEFNPQNGEVLLHIEDLGVYAAVSKSLDKRTASEV